MAYQMAVRESFVQKYTNLFVELISKPTATDVCLRKLNVATKESSSV